MAKITPKQYAISLYQTIDDSRSEDRQKLIENFVRLLAENNDLNMSTKIISEFDRYFKKINKQEDLKITTAIELPEKLKQQIADQFKTDNIQAINIKPKIDEKMLGGIIIQFQDKLLDASLKNQLNNLNKALIS